MLCAPLSSANPRQDDFVQNPRNEPSNLTGERQFNEIDSSPWVDFVKPVIQLDDVDRRILRALQEDAGLSQQAIAEAVGASPTSCWRRIRSLEEAGVLKRAVRLVDPVAVGRRVTVMLQVRLKSHMQVSGPEFEAFVQRQPDVMECYMMSGEWDYLMRVVVADVDDYQRFLGEVLNHPNVASSASNFALNKVKYTTAVPV